jgi:hypothetical protein
MEHRTPVNVHRLTVSAGWSFGLAGHRLGSWEFDGSG